jgi:hypothetical protein
MTSELGNDEEENQVELEEGSGIESHVQDEEEEEELSEESEEELDEEEDDGEKSEATTGGRPAASSVERRHIYRLILMDSIKLKDIAPPLIRNELTQAGFVLNSGRVLPFLFDAQENSNEHQRLRKAILYRPGFGAGEKKWLSWLAKYLHAGFESESYVPLVPTGSS